MLDLTLTDEVGLSQVLIAIDPHKLQSSALNDAVIERMVEDIKASVPVEPGTDITYPGERILLTRRSNLEHGIPVMDNVWETICRLA